MLNLALGYEYIVYDFGARKPIPRATYQGLEFIKYVLSRRWLNKEYVTNVKRCKNKDRKNNCNDYFDKCYEQLEDRTKLDYFLQYINTDEIRLKGVTDCTQHDGDKEFHKNVLKKAV